MSFELFPSLAAIAFAAILFYFFLKRRSGEINGGQANNDAAINDGTARGASFTHTSAEDHGCTRKPRYEVFLSFRGKDTGEAFADFLYTILTDMGICTFRDDEELLDGQEIGPYRLKAINDSQISIPIFSKGYATSVRCLKELVQMVECQKTREQKIMPIFYDVAPPKFQHLTESYKEAFHSHKKKRQYDEETMCQWKASLNAVETLKGWDLKSMPKRREGQFAKTLAQRVFNELKKGHALLPNILVSVDHQVNTIMKMIDAQTSETLVIGIHGRGGIGKTIIAKIIYNKLVDNFEDHCILFDIKAESNDFESLKDLQRKLICDILKTSGLTIRNIDEGIQIIKSRLSRKRVLLLLDGVNEKNQLDVLAGNRDWFGKGSRLIITTRNKDILNVRIVDNKYEVNGMDFNQSLQLFSRYAFRRDYPPERHLSHSKEVIENAGGHPLTLACIGSFLCDQEWIKWDGTLKRIKDVPPNIVQKIMEISYDALDNQQKHIFLDIACLFTGYDKNSVVHFWDESNFFPEEAIEVLQNMSLIKIKEDNKVWMDDQLRNFGKKIVHQDGKWKRVWDPKKASNLLRRQKGKKEVEALRLGQQRQYHFTREDFMGLSNLKFLEVDSSMGSFDVEERLLWHESPSNVLLSNDFEENSDLLPQLQWLSWHNIPPIFNIRSFSMKKIVILDLSRSEIMNDWNGWSHLKVIKNLKILNLTGCYCLERTPDFSAHANLERLILRGCSKLVDIDKSICQLKHLVCLDVRYCRHLRRLPDKLGGLAAMKELLIDCTLIDEFPNCHGMRNLRIFTASRCPIISLPCSIRELVTLEYLSLRDCRSLRRLPDSIGNLESLIELDISGTRIKELPHSIRDLRNSESLKITMSSI